MEEKIFEILQGKGKLKEDDVVALFVVCKRMMQRNEKLAEQLKDAIDKVVKLEKRIDFYRSAGALRVV